MPYTFVRIDWATARRTGWRVLWLFALFLLLFLGQPLQAQDRNDPPVTTTPIVVGSKDYTENILLGKLLVLLLREAGYTVVDQTNYGGTVAVRTALETGAIDLYVESAATALSLYHQLPLDALPDDPQRAHQLAKSLDQDQGVIWLAPYTYRSSFALIATPSLAEQGVTSIADLAVRLKSGTTVRLCAWNEFYGRPQGGLDQLQALYDLTFNEEDILITDYEETFAGLHEGRCEVGIGLLTDSRIAAWQLTVLRDPRVFFVVDSAAPVIWQAVLAADPALADVINELSPYLSQEVMRTLKIQIELGADGEAASGDEAAVETVAQEFLRSIGLLELPRIVVGSKTHTSSILVGKMLVRLLQEAGYAVVDETGYGGAVALRTALEQGKIDLYAESSGTALSLFHGLPPAAQPDERRRSYQLASTLDEENEIVWLEPSAYDDKFAVVIDSELTGQGVSSLADLVNVFRTDDGANMLCTWDEFYGRSQGGLAALFDTYSFSVVEENIFIADLDEVFQGVRTGRCAVAVVAGTDSRIATWQLPVLADPLVFFPIDIPTPTLRRDLLARNPGVGPLLNQLGPLLTDETIQQLTARIDIGADGEVSSGDEEQAEAVAQDFLRSRRLLKLPPLTVGSMTEPEQVLLGHLSLLLLQSAGYEVIDKTGLGDAVTVRQALEAGTIDLAWEESAQALLLFHKVPTAAVPTDPKRTYALARTLDARKELLWLPSAVNAGAYTLLVGDTLWNSGVENIRDLAALAAERASPLTICVVSESQANAVDGLAILASGYNLTFPAANVRALDRAGIYEALRFGECDVAEGSGRDGRAAAWNFHELADPQALFPAGNLAPVLRQSVSDANDELSGLLNTLLAQLTDATLRTLTERIMIGPDGELYSGDEETVQTVAAAFLAESGLMTLYR